MNARGQGSGRTPSAADEGRGPGRLVGPGAVTHPNFLVIGAPRAGTTTLYALLGQHPDVLMAQPKEPHFFDLHYGKGLAAYWRDHFGAWSGQRAVGEATASYFHLTYTAPRVRRDLPDARLIVSLRNPIDRAHSLWWLVRALGREPRSFELAVLEELERLAAGVGYQGDHGEQLWRARALVPPAESVRRIPYLAAGHYAATLRTWFDVVTRDRVKVVLFEDLVADPGRVVRELWGFLGVDPAQEVVDLRPRNAALRHWARGLYRLHRVGAVRRLVRLGVPPPWRRRVRRLLQRGERPPLDPRTRALLVDYFRPRNRELETVLDRDLSPWDR